MELKEDLESYLRLDQINNTTFRSRNNLIPLKSVFGGQFLGQSIAAARATVPSHMQINCMQSHFLRMGGTEPIFYHVENIMESKKFAIREVKVIQDDKIVFTSKVSFHDPEIPLIKYQVASMPIVQPPEKCPKSDGGFFDQARFSLGNIPSYFSDPFEIRPCMPMNAFLFKESWTEPERIWIKVLKRHSENEDAFQHCIYAAFISDICISNVTMRPDIEAWKGQYVFRLSLNQNMTFHTPFRTDEWILMERFSPLAGNGLGFVEGRMWTSNGILASTFSQEILLRAGL